MEFKDLLKNRRLELGLTLKEVGDAVGVSQSTVKRWESGEIKNLRRDKIAALSQTLHTTPYYLMGWEKQEPKEVEETQDELLKKRKLLFDMSAKASSEDLDKILTIVDTLLEDNGFKKID